MATLTSPNGRGYQPFMKLGEGSFGNVYKCIMYEGATALPGYVALKVVSWHEKRLNRDTVLSEKATLETIAPHDGVIRLLDSWFEEKPKTAHTEAETDTMLVEAVEATASRAVAVAEVQEGGAQEARAHEGDAEAEKMEDVDEGVLFLVMDYFEHGNLLEYSKTHHIDDSTLCDLHLQFLRIIEHVHSQGFIFFDVKPDNILLVDTNPPRIVLADFGSARTQDQIGSCKMAFDPFYAAPELRDPTKWNILDAGCDYYAWCISLFYLMVAQDWPKNKHTDSLNTLGEGDEKRSMNFSLLPAGTSERFQGFLTVGFMSAPWSRKERMTTHPWVTKRPSAVQTPEEPPLFGVKIPAGPEPEPRVVAATHAIARLFASVSSDTGSTAGPSTPATVRGPAVKRASVEKCLEKEKVGKISSVDSTADKRASAASKKASKPRTRAGPTQTYWLSGPAQAVIRRRNETGRRKDYTC